MAKKKILLVLAHGIFGWGDSKSGDLDPVKDYYYGVGSFLQSVCESRDSTDIKIVFPSVIPSESVDQRGQELKQKIQQALGTMPDGTRAHIIAHSMGGLDSRWVIASGGMADQIASLTTIATPHRGTRLGDLAYHLRGPIRALGTGLDLIAEFRLKAKSIISELGIPTFDELEFYHHLLNNVIENSSPEQLERGLNALTIEGAKEFNNKIADAEREIRNRTTKPVSYFAYGGVYGSYPVNLLKVSHDLLCVVGIDVEKLTGNDGAVSVWSAHYPWDDDGEHYIRTLPFDHFKQINWEIPVTSKDPNMPNELRQVYQEIIDRILGLEA